MMKGGGVIEWRGEREGREAKRWEAAKAFFPSPLRHYRVFGSETVSETSATDLRCPLTEIIL